MHCIFSSEVKIWLNQMDPNVNINKWNRLALVWAKWCFIRKVFHSASPDKCFFKYAIAIFMVGKVGFLVLLCFSIRFNSSFSYLNLEKKTVENVVKSIDKSSQKENLRKIPFKKVLLKGNYITNGSRFWGSKNKNPHNSCKMNKLLQGVWHLLSLMRLNSWWGKLKKWPMNVILKI